MTGVVLGKPNAETLASAQFRDLLDGLIQAGYVQSRVVGVEPQIYTMDVVL
ncbi:MAG: hypothetical protein AAAB16_20480 [Pseudomonas sp.]|uniref:hypothetical protein n=1 Tax=Pseudomonas sp. TaxID=306 RepID=UPI0030F220B2